MCSLILRIISFTAGTFGDELALLEFRRCDFDDTLAPAGNVNLYEFSYNALDDLDNFQAGDFVLASLTFDAMACGTSAIGLSFIVLGDSNGDPFTTDPTIYNGDVTVTPIPEPATLALLGSGLFGLIGFRRKFMKN